MGYKIRQDQISDADARRDCDTDLDAATKIPITLQFSVRRAKNLLICLVFLEPRPSILAPVLYRCALTGAVGTGRAFE